MPFTVFKSPPSEIQVAGTLTNYGPGTVYYRDEQPVSATVNDGFLTTGQSAVLEGSQWVVSASQSAVAVFEQQTAPGGRFRGLFKGQTRYLAGDIVISDGAPYYADTDFTSVAVFEITDWLPMPSTPSGGPVVLPEADYEALDAPDPKTRYLVSEDGGASVNAIYEGLILTYSLGSRPPVNKTLPFITYTGAIALGTVLRGNPGAWRRGPTKFTYRWLKDGVAINGATAATYTLVSGDQSSSITFEITPTNISDVAAAVTSPAVAIGVYPLYDTFTETAATGIASHTADSGHTWAIVAGSGQSTTVSSGRLRGGSAAAVCVSRSSWVPAGQSYLSRAFVTAASALTGMGNGLRIGATGDGYFCQWLKSTSQYQIYKRVSAVKTAIGSPITDVGGGARYMQLEIAETDATHATLTLKVGFSPSSLSSVATQAVDPTADGLTLKGSAGVFNDASSFSDSTRVQVTEMYADAIAVAPPVPVNTVAPSITTDGTPAVGETVTGNNGTWTNSPTLTVQWMRNSQAITGETASTYTLVTADVGQSVGFQVKGVNAAAPNGVTASSAAITPGGGGTPVVFGGRIFAATSVWDRPYDPALDLTISNSADVVLNLSRQARRKNPQTGAPQTSIGAAWINTATFSTAEHIVNGNSATRYPVALIDYGKDKTETQLEPLFSSVPIPLNARGARPYPHEAIFAKASTGSTSGWDGHAAIYDIDTDTLYECWKFRNWYEDGITPITIVVTNGSTSDQVLPAATFLTLDKPGGGTISFKTTFAKTIVAGASTDVLIEPVVITAAEATSIPAASNPQLVSPPTWVSLVQPGYVPPTRHFFLDASYGGQGKYSVQWGGVVPLASTKPGYYSGSQKFWGATACSLSVAGGLITRRDLESGVIAHALAIAVRYGGNRVRRPAQRTDTNNVMTPPAPAEGQRFVLDQTVDENDPRYKPFPILPLMIKAAKNYGIINRDASGNVTFYCEDSTSAGGIDYRATWFGNSFPDYVLNFFPWERLMAVARTDEPLCDVNGNIVPEGG